MPSSRLSAIHPVQTQSSLRLPSLSSMQAGLKLVDDDAQRLWLLSAMAERSTGGGGYVSPPAYMATTSPNKRMRFSPPSKETEEVTEEMKKARRREQCRINQANYRKRQREYASAGTLKLSPSLNADQAAALKMALDACNYAASRSRSHKAKQLARVEEEPQETHKMTTEELKKERRRQQCRVNQANYRKRQREREQQPETASAVNTLKMQIDQLQQYKQQLMTRPLQKDPLQTIGDFYYGLGVDARQQLPEIESYQRSHGYSPALEMLLDLQREEFDSIESLKFHWLWYRSQFRVFDLAITSFQRVDVGEHVVIKVCGELQLDVYADVKKRGGKKAGYGTIACPVMQQFEVEAGGQTIRRITSEVDFVSGVVAIRDQRDPEQVLSTLQCLSEGFRISNRS